MSSPYGLPKSKRLCSLSEIQELFDHGESIYKSPLRAVYTIQKDDKESVRVLFSVPRKRIKLAAKRNLIKRRLREAYRLNQHSIDLPAGINLSIAFIYSSNNIIEYTNIQYSIIKLLDVMMSKINKS